MPRKIIECNWQSGGRVSNRRFYDTCRYCSGDEFVEQYVTTWDGYGGFVEEEVTIPCPKCSPQKKDLEP